jgi:hypothetical protein
LEPTSDETILFPSPDLINLKAQAAQWNVPSIKIRDVETQHCTHDQEPAMQGEHQRFGGLPSGDDDPQEPHETGVEDGVDLDLWLPGCH